MKLSKVKNIIREETRSVLSSKSKTLNEGMFDKLVAMIVDKIVKTKYKKYFDELHSDPEYKEALKAVNNAAEKINLAAKSYEKAKTKSDKTYDEYAKKYGKQAADKIVADTKAGSYRLSWKKPIIPKKYRD